jgi:hypothetical protein
MDMNRNKIMDNNVQCGVLLSDLVNGGSDFLAYVLTRRIFCFSEKLLWSIWFDRY